MSWNVARLFLGWWNFKWFLFWHRNLGTKMIPNLTSKHISKIWLPTSFRMIPNASIKVVLSFQMFLVVGHTRMSQEVSKRLVSVLQPPKYSIISRWNNALIKMGGWETFSGFLKRGLRTAGKSPPQSHRALDFSDQSVPWNVPPPWETRVYKKVLLRENNG